jgi:hypothetical protein
VYNKDSNYRNSESRSEKGAQSYNSNSSRRGYWSSLDSKMQERANEHGNNASKAKKGLRQFVVERCIVVQLTDVNQAEPALYHFENDEYGGSDIHHYAVNSRTKKMLLQFDCLDGNCSVYFDINEEVYVLITRQLFRYFAYSGGVHLMD